VSGASDTTARRFNDSFCNLIMTDYSLGKMNWKSLTAGLACCGIGFGLVILLEVSLRVVFPELAPKAKEIPNQDLAYQFHSEYLVSLKPNITNVYTTSAEMGGEQIVWTTNSHSFRGKELEGKTDIRIMVYGDSNIQARFSKLEDTFPYKLQEYLKVYLSQNIEVLNAGIIGFGPDQILLKFRNEVDIYKPAIVVINIFAENDFGDIIRNRIFELDKHEKLVRTGHRAEMDEAFTDVYSKAGDLRGYILSSIILTPIAELGKLVLKDLEARKLMDRIQSLTEEEYSVYKKRQPRKFSHFADHYDFDIAINPESESSRVKLKLMEAVVKELKVVALSKGVELVVVIQPSVIDLTENFKFSFKHLEKYSGYQRSNLTNGVETICLANRIHHINLFNTFLKNNPERLYFRGGDPHWNNLGQRIAARETGSYLLQKMLRYDAIY
jgi:hypothetical protein